MKGSKTCRRDEFLDHKTGQCKKTAEQHKKTTYYVLDTAGKQLLGTHPTRSEIYSSQKVLYEGTNARLANRIYRIENKGLGVYDEGHNVLIYKGYEGEERAVIHKV